jgi:hypothetical protein
MSGTKDALTSDTAKEIYKHTATALITIAIVAPEKLPSLSFLKDIKLPNIDLSNVGKAIEQAGKDI